MTISLENNLKKSYDNFIERILLNGDIDAMTLSLSEFVSNLHEDEINQKALTYFNFYKKWEEFIKQYSRKTTFYDYINETLFVHAYQTFEIFISETFEILYKFFPKFNKVNANNKVDRDTNFIKKKNIISIMNRFTSFGLKINFFKEYEKDLLLISQKRNLIIHKNSVVNSDFLNKLKEENINSKYKLGQFLTKKDLNIVKQQMTLIKIASKLHKNLVEKEFKIIELHDSL